MTDQATPPHGTPAPATTDHRTTTPGTRATTTDHASAGSPPARPPRQRGAGAGTLTGRGVRYLRRRPLLLVRLGAWSVLESVQTMLSGYAVARAVDGFLGGRTGDGLGWLALGGLAVLLGAVGTGRVYRALADLVEPLRDALVRRVVRRGLREADPSAVARLTHQVEIARDTFAGVVTVARSFLFTAVGAVVGLLALSRLLLLVVLPPVFAGLVLFATTLRPAARAQERFLAADESVARETGLVVGGLRDVTAAGAEREARAGISRVVRDQAAAARRLAWWGVPRGASLAAGGQLPVVVLVFAAPWLLRHGVTPGGLVGALTCLTQSLLPALRDLAYGLGGGGSRLGVVARRLIGPAETPQRMGAAVPGDAAGGPAGAPAVELRGVTFRYGATARAVLAEVDLTVPVGGHLAVVGPSGIGKSTLAGLVAGLLEPADGEVRLEGRTARAAESVARRVLIPQEAYVFSGTLRENLEYLRDGRVPDEELRAALAALGAEALAVRVGGLDGRLDPGRLSAGERQLVALTRAWLAPARVAVLDEATCHLDPVAEARAERAFAARPGGTLIVVAHRVSSALRADQVLVMDGSAALSGRHGDLLARSPLYRDLVGAWA